MAQLDLEKIREDLRKDQKKQRSQNEQAKKMGLDQATIQKFVSPAGGRGLGLKSLLQICAHLGKCPLCYLEDGLKDDIAHHPLQKRLIRICDLMFDNDFPFDEPEVFELLAMQIEGLYKKYCEPKGKNT